MKPLSISENLMFNTIRLVSDNGSVGTGSFFSFKFNEREVTVIITNRHVVKNNPIEPMTFMLHIANESQEPTENFSVRYTAHWYLHENHDLCFCYANPLFSEILSTFDKKVYIRQNYEAIIPDKSQLEELSAIEELVMVGYPITLWDERNNLPIFRKGYTACHPAIDFNRDGIGLADIPCFPGSSGSPIYILNEGSFRDKKGNTHFGSSRFYLIGFLFEAPQFNATGDLIIQSVPSTQTIKTRTPFMVNLGYYVKSSTLLDFRAQIEQDLSGL